MPVIVRLSLALVCLLGLSACSGGVDGSPPPQATVSGSGTSSASEGIKLESSLVTAYYDVYGLTTEAIFEYIEKNGPTLDDGTRGSGIASIVWAYHWTGSKEGGGCKIDSMTIKADIAVLLPRHAMEASLSPPLRENWGQYARAVATHEQRHVDIYLEGANDIKAEMSEIGRQKDCQALETEVEAVWSEEQTRINGLQQQFHHEEDDKNAAKRRPLEAQIQVNNSRLATMQNEITSLERKVSSLKAELSSLDVQLANVDAQIEQITQQFPGVLPDTVRQRLEGLVIQQNELIGGYNARVEVHNDALSDLTALLKERPKLVETTKALLDELNWLR